MLDHKDSNNITNFQFSDGFQQQWGHAPAMAPLGNVLDFILLLCLEKHADDFTCQGGGGGVETVRKK
jgi:hypothetical protein